MDFLRKLEGLSPYLKGACVGGLEGLRKRIYISCYLLQWKRRRRERKNDIVIKNIVKS